MNYNRKRIRFTMESGKRQEKLWFDIFTLEGYGILTIPDKMSQFYRSGDSIGQWKIGTDQDRIIEILGYDASSIFCRRYSQGNRYTKWNVKNVEIEENCQLFPFL